MARAVSCSAWGWAPPTCRRRPRCCARGVEFVASKGAQLDSRGALTRTVMGSVMFELVHHERGAAAQAA